MAKTKCMYCGANQVPHLLEWYQETMEVLLSPIRRALIYNPLGKLIFLIVDAIGNGLLIFFSWIGIVKYNTDPEKIKIERGKVLFKEAHARGWQIRELRLLGRPIDVYEVYIHGKRLIFSSLPRPRHYFNAALDWSDDKAILKKKLRQADLPVPAGRSVCTYWGALRTFNKLQKPVIVKPRIGSRGRHTTTFIYTEDELKRAYKIAKQLGNWVIVEEHLVGAVFRGTVIDGKCIGVLGGDPPKVTGDGAKTIAELIAIKNANKNPHVKDIVIDDKMRWFLSRTNLTLESVLPEGLTIDLTEKIGISYGGSSFEVTPQTHPDILRMFEAAAAVVGDPLLGFDFIAPDISRSWKEQRCGIIECNGLPFINLHHDPLIGQPINAAGFVWNMVEKSYASN